MFNKSQGKMKKILEKSGNFVRGKKWEPWKEQHSVVTVPSVTEAVFHTDSYP